MGKKKSNTPREEHLLLPMPPSSSGIVDTHMHLTTTYSFYRQRYKEGKYKNVFDFIKAMYEGQNMEAIVDVWCDAPVQKLWKTFVDLALTPEDQQSHRGGIEYWFALGELAMFYGGCDADDICPRCSSVSRISLSGMTQKLTLKVSHDTKHYTDTVENDMYIPCPSYSLLHSLPPPLPD